MAQCRDRSFCCRLAYVILEKVGCFGCFLDLLFLFIQVEKVCLDFDEKSSGFWNSHGKVMYVIAYLHVHGVYEGSAFVCLLCFLLYVRQLMHQTNRGYIYIVLVSFSSPEIGRELVRNVDSKFATSAFATAEFFILSWDIIKSCYP